jgi:broad specificity phosphatase PhoE
MDNIYLVRHGESAANVDKSVHFEVADHAISLSERGQAQARGAGDALLELLDIGDNEPLRIWTSPYKRTRQTTQGIAERLKPHFPHLDVREHINLCEQQFGLFDGIPDEDLPKRFPAEHAHYKLCEAHEGRFWARMPLGESRFDVAVRVHQAFGTFHRDADRHGVRNIIIVCHGVTLRAFVMQWLHLTPEWFEQERNPGNCDIYHISGHDKAVHGYVYQNGVLVQNKLAA